MRIVADHQNCRPLPLPALRSGTLSFTFKDDVVMDEAEQTLLLARLATESLYGKGVVALDAQYQIDFDSLTIAIDTACEAGRTLAILFRGYALAEFGGDAVELTRLPAREAM